MMGFIVGLPLTWIWAFLGFAAAVALAAVTARVDRRSLCLGSVMAVLVIVLCCWLCTFFFDLSYDGNAYHKAAIASLEAGWNPVYASMDDWAGGAGMLDAVSGSSIWCDHYPQGLWSVCACLYQLLGSIEAAKAPMLVAYFAASLMVSSYGRLKGLRIWQAVLLFAVVLVNPLTVAQFSTFYCDAFLAMELLAMLCGFVMMATADGRTQKILGLLVACCSFVSLATAKFTGILYGGVFGLSFFLFLVWDARPFDADGRSRSNLLRLFCLFAAVVVFSVGIAGFSPYVTNFIDHGNPLYPLAGEGAVDIMTPYTPVGYEDKSNFERLMLSIFSETGNSSVGNGQPWELKVPFTVSQNELEVLSIPDARVGGFGVLYSAIFLFSIPLGVCALVLAWKKSRRLFVMQVCYLIPALLLALCLSESWWARYSGYLYFWNISIVVSLFYLSEQLKSRHGKIVLASVSTAFSVLLLCNARYFLEFNASETFDRTNEIKESILQLKEASDAGAEITVWADGYPAGEIYTLRDYDVAFVFDPSSDGSEPLGKLRFLRYDCSDLESVM